MLARILIAISWVSRSPGSVEVPITAGSSCHGAALSDNRPSSTTNVSLTKLEAIRKPFRTVAARSSRMLTGMKRRVMARTEPVEPQV